MAPVVDTPIIRHIFDLLARHGLCEAYVNDHYLVDALLEACGEESHVNGIIVPLLREEELTGAAGAVKRLARVTSKSDFDKTFVVVSDDTVTEADIKDMVAFHRKKSALKAAPIGE